jgi:hypothetical protein
MEGPCEADCGLPMKRVSLRPFDVDLPGSTGTVTLSSRGNTVNTATAPTARGILRKTLASLENRGPLPGEAGGFSTARDAREDLSIPVFLRSKLAGGLDACDEARFFSDPGQCIVIVDVEDDEAGGEAKTSQHRQPSRRQSTSRGTDSRDQQQTARGGKLTAHVQVRWREFSRPLTWSSPSWAPPDGDDEGKNPTSTTCSSKRPRMSLSELPEAGRAAGVEEGGDFVTNVPFTVLADNARGEFPSLLSCPSRLYQ